MAAYHVDPENPKVLVLWQPKAWADLSTCVEWAEKGLGAFLESEKITGQSLLLCDNLSAQVKSEFTAAVKNAGAAETWFGPPGATHIWQPADHHVGARYKLLLGQKYDEFMVTEFDALPAGAFTAAKRRTLLVKWTGEVYDQLEAERQKAESARVKDPTLPASLFHRAFVSTGCMVGCDFTTDGSEDAKLIRPHRTVEGELLRKLHSQIHTLFDA
jgi:hypothetical protein